MSNRECTDLIDAYLAYTVNSESPEIFLRWAIIGAIAACLQRKTYTYWCNDWIFPNMFIVLIGPSGKARKGTAFTPVMKLLREAGIRIAPDNVTPESLIQEMRTVEACSNPLEDGSSMCHSSLTVFSEEFTIFTGQKNMALMQQLCTLYDCRDKFVKSTISRGQEDITGVWLNIVGATTPGTLQEALPAEAVEGGFMSRTVFVYSEGSGKRISPLLTYSPQEIQMNKKLQQAIICDMQNIYTITGEFTATPDFRDAFGEWYVKHSDDTEHFKTSALEAYKSRRAAHLIKLCMIHSASRGNSKQLIKLDFERSLRALLEAECHMWRVFEGFGKDPTASVRNRILRFIISKIKIGEVMDYATVIREFKNDLNKASMIDSFSLMEASGYIQPFQERVGDKVIHKFKLLRGE
jgi:hypothetical protein